jgi:monofunctional biosynthetic peptidoglycan transglycosylase
VLAGYYAGIFYTVWRLRDHNPRLTAFMKLGLQQLRAGNPAARLQRRWVPYDRISVNLKRAVIASEDQRFLEHDGFDVQAMEEALEKNARRGRIRHGASTISQQLAKNLFLSPKRTYLRKVHEAVITMMLEHVLTKRRIFEIYLNVIEWGEGIYGAEAAAQHYYEEPAADLSPRKAARLAAMIPSPRFYTRNTDTPYLDQRTDFLLDQMEFARIP